MEEEEEEEEETEEHEEGSPTPSWFTVPDEQMKWCVKQDGQDARRGRQVFVSPRRSKNPAALCSLCCRTDKPSFLACLSTSQRT